MKKTLAILLSLQLYFFVLDAKEMKASVGDLKSSNNRLELNQTSKDKDSKIIGNLSVDILKTPANDITPLHDKEKNLLNSKIRLTTSTASLPKNKKMEFIQFLEASGTLILSGLFDRSFFITTLMAIKYSKTITLISATTSLTFIGIIAVFLGVTINKYVPLFWIESIAVGLFFLFGFHMIYDAYIMDLKKHSDSLDAETNINHEDSEAGKILNKTNKTDNVENPEKNINLKIQINDEIYEHSKLINYSNSHYSKKDEKNENKINNKINCVVVSKSNNKNYTIDKESSLHENSNVHNYNNNLGETAHENFIKKSLHENEKFTDDNHNIFDVNEAESQEKDNSSFIKAENFEVFCKVFVLIFFSEIGDRSQISTIYLTSTFDKFIVLLGVIISSFILSVLAVFGGKIISDKISEKKLTASAGILFVFFGLGALIMLFLEKNEKIDELK